LVINISSIHDARSEKHQVIAWPSFRMRILCCEMIDVRGT